MDIDLRDPDEPKLNLAQACRFFAPSRTNRPVHKSRLIRYIVDGVLGPDGTRVRLAALRQGHGWVTTPSAIQAFCEALTPKRRDAAGATHTPSARRASDAKAARELDRLGIK
jgi:hypothetical protein